MNSDCKRIQKALLDGVEPAPATTPRPVGHIDGCADCRSFVALERFLASPTKGGLTAAPRHLIGQTLLRLEPPMRERARERRRVSLRVAAAGLASLPAIAACNLVIARSLHFVLDRFVSAEVALAGVTVFAASVLLSLAIAYGSLPLMANWGMRLREEGV
jgi:hypothetical protein